jgi:hypothetical protein
VNDSLLPFVFGGFIAIAVVELLLSVKWNRGYMTTGIPIFIRRVDRPEGLEDVSLEALQKSTATFAGTPILFQRVDPNRIVFREQSAGGSIHYFALMRGMIRRRDGEPSVVILGFLKYWAIALVAGFAIIGGRHWFAGMPYILGAFAVLYFIQFVRYGRIAKALRSASSATPPALPPRAPA